MIRDHAGEAWVTIDEAADMWGIRPKTLRAWRERGKVRSHRTEHGIWLAAADVTRAEKSTRGKYVRQRGASVA